VPLPIPDRRRARPWALAACLLLAAACERRPAERPRPHPPAATPPARPPEPAPARYARLDLTSPKDLADLQARLGAARFAEVLKLNRVDLGHARKGDHLLLPPEGVVWIDLSPFPAQWAEVDGQPKFVAVSLRLQAWAAYEGGNLLRWGPVSTGSKKSPTPPGLYHTNWCQRKRTSTFNGEWELEWYVNLHNAAGISFHQYELPGYPDSHACIRLAPDDAEWLYRWCGSWKLSPDQRTVLQEGTPVVVFGAYGFGKAKPWKDLVEHPEAGRLAREELAEAVRVLRQAVAPEIPEDMPET
jgi:hypothetical protein